jgi:hypothetical protein
VSIPIVAEPADPRTADARRKLARMEVYRRAGSIGRTPTRAFLVALVAWRLGDIPAELPPAPGDFGLSERVGAAWAATVDAWLREAIAEIRGRE